MKQQTGLWVFAAIVLALIVAIVAYFTLIGPELDSASEARENSELTRQENDLLEMQIAQMIALEAQVPDWREQIAKISLDLPPRVEEADLERLIVSQLDAVALPLVNMTTGRPSPVDPLAVAGFEPPSVEPVVAPSSAPTSTPTQSDSAEADDIDTDGASGGTVDGSTTTPTTPEPPFEGLLAMPVTVTTEGDPTAVVNFINSMGNQLSRFYTITNITIQKASPTEEAPGRPALTEGHWVVQVTGLVFSLLDDTRSVVDDEQVDLPAYDGGAVRNPFAPLPGTEEGGN